MDRTDEEAVDGGDRFDKGQRRWWIAYPLWLLLGAFGAHRFYLGRDRTGTIQILALLFGFFTLTSTFGVVLLAALSAWVLLDGLLMPFMLVRDNRARRNRLAQIGAGAAS